MPFVLDASVAGAWIMPNETKPQTETLLAQLRHDYAIVPELWWAEIRNLLLINERRGRITVSDTKTGLILLASLNIDVDHDPSSALVMDLARRHGLTVYDAIYLALAKQQGIGLATLDEKLVGAAKAESVPLLAA